MATKRITLEEFPFDGELVEIVVDLEYTVRECASSCTYGTEYGRETQEWTEVDLERATVVAVAFESYAVHLSDPMGERIIGPVQAAFDKRCEDDADFNDRLLQECECR